MSAVIEPSVDSCTNGGFFDGNDDFGGPPYRFFIAVLVIAPLAYLAGSASLWAVTTYRRRQAEQVAAASSSSPAVAVNSSSPQHSNYSSLYDASPSPSSSASSSPVYPSFSPAPDCVPYDASASPTSSDAVAPLSTSLLSSAEQRASDQRFEPSVTRRTQFLLFLRSLTRPNPLFRFTVVISMIQLVLSVFALGYGAIAGEHCCMGGTGAIYATLCLRVCLCYLNVRVGYWQTHSRESHIYVADKSSSIGFLIHYIWLSVAFVLIESGDCSSNAPVIFGVSMMNTVFLLVNYFIFALFTLINYISHSRSDVMIVLSRTCIKLCTIGWAYGGALDLHDAVTDIEMEIACMPCVTYDELVQRERDRLMRKQLVMKHWTGNDDNGASISIIIEDIRTDDQKVNDGVVEQPSSSSSSSSSPSPPPPVEQPEQLSCAICLSAYEPTDIIRPLPCAHHLHKSCSDSWLKVKSTCPLCVRSVLIQ